MGDVRMRAGDSVIHSRLRCLPGGAGHHRPQLPRRGGLIGVTRHGEPERRCCAEKRSQHQPDVVMTRRRLSGGLTRDACTPRSGRELDNGAWARARLHHKPGLSRWIWAGAADGTGRAAVLADALRRRKPLPEPDEAATYCYYHAADFSADCRGAAGPSGWRATRRGMTRRISNRH